MRYISSRSKQNEYSFEETLFNGYASDGGMFMPKTLPKLSLDHLSNISHDFVTISTYMMELFVCEDEIPLRDRRQILLDILPKFSTPKVVPIVTMKDGVRIAELHHGETLAFKDIGLSVIGKLMEYFLKKNDEHKTVLVGTSGDTGSAAIYALKSLERVDLIVLYPFKRITDTQEMQITTSNAANIHVFAVEGTSDDLDVPIKKCFLDKKFRDLHSLCSVNSVNWVRIMFQMVPYILTYMKVCSYVGETVRFVVPTGAAGNITAGNIAQLMGLPIQLVACVNQNDIIYRMLKDGIYSMRNPVKTLASAMDIQAPYNVERLFYLHSKFDVDRVQNLMKEVESNADVTIPSDVLVSIRESIVDFYSVDDEAILETMKKCHQDNSYLVCPHTATAVNYCYNRKMKDPFVVMATASAAKFPEAAAEANLPKLENASIENLKNKTRTYDFLRKDDDWTKLLKQRIVEITNKASFNNN